MTHKSDTNDDDPRQVPPGFRRFANEFDAAHVDDDFRVHKSVLERRHRSDVRVFVIPRNYQTAIEAYSRDPEFNKAIDMVAGDEVPNAERFPDEPGEILREHTGEELGIETTHLHGTRTFDADTVARTNTFDTIEDAVKKAKREWPESEGHPPEDEPLLDGQTIRPGFVARPGLPDRHTVDRVAVAIISSRPVTFVTTLSSGIASAVEGAVWGLAARIPAPGTSDVDDDIPDDLVEHARKRYISGKTDDVESERDLEEALERSEDLPDDVWADE